MCLILFACREHPDYPLVMAANRDEFHARPTRPAQWWDDAPDLLAGKDLSAGGTWLGITRSGRIAAVTNYRDPASHDPGAHSRGELTRHFLQQDCTRLNFQRHLQQSRSRYNGYNLLFGSVTDLHYFSNHSAAPSRISPGVYGLSNHLLDTPWPKVRKGKQALSSALQDRDLDLEKLWDLLADDAPAPAGELPDTGISQAWEKRLSSIRIVGDHYGTRTSTLLTYRKDGLVQFIERTLLNNSETSFSFNLLERGEI